MNRSIEKRHSPRHPLETRLECGHVQQGCRCRSRLINYSEGGLCLEAECPFAPGACLIIRMLDGPPAVAGRRIHSGLRAVTMGEVKWCTALPAGTEPRYTVGIRYYPPY